MRVFNRRVPKINCYDDDDDVDDDDDDDDDDIYKTKRYGKRVLTKPNVFGAWFYTYNSFPKETTARQSI